MWQFKTTKTLDARREEAKVLRENNPDKVPIILEPHETFRGDFRLASRIVVNKRLTMADFKRYLYKANNLGEKDGLFLFVNGSDIVAQPMTSVGVVYR
jgi:hypothetical protein